MAAYKYREIPHVYETEKPRLMPFVNYSIRREIQITINTLVSNPVEHGE